MNGILIYGIPTAGKSTIGKLLGTELAVVHISMGQLLRDRAESDPVTQALVASGELLSDRTVIRVIQQELDTLDVEGFVLDGFPRTMEQLRFLRGRSVFRGCLHILLAMDLSVARGRFHRRMNCAVCHRADYPPLTARTARCPSCGGSLVQRVDATPEAFDRRMAAFEEHEKPVMAELDREGLLLQVPVTGAPDLDFLRLLQVEEVHRHCT